MVIAEIAVATLDVVGKILVSYTVLQVHHRMLVEHKMDEIVFNEIKAEQRIGMLGIALMVAAYLLKLLLLGDVL
ncbi:hypothetical protein ACFL26_02010 [Patescibacteria group bacterium]